MTLGNPRSYAGAEEVLALKVIAPALLKQYL